jgi:hypothetical protein
MKTTATNRKVRELLLALREGTLEPRPEFQRRLVWNNNDKCAFLYTVLLNYPFPEIYIAAGEVDVETGEAKEMLVDGQQRITTLYQYFSGSPDLRLTREVQPYSQLPQQAKEDFLQYDVVVRDLGKIAMEQIREVFRRINATSYALNAMEIHNARYEGEYKTFAEDIAQRPFFDEHRIFSPQEIRRMQDTRFILTFITTVISTYFNRDEMLEEYLSQYNDEFPLKSDVEREIDNLLSFIEAMNLPPKARAWKKADLFTLLVELHRARERDKLKIDAHIFAEKLLQFYEQVDKHTEGLSLPVPSIVEEDEDEEGISNYDVNTYYRSSLQATNDRGSRIARGKVVQKLIRIAANSSEN